MNKLLILVTAVILCASLPPVVVAQDGKTVYNKALADSLGADQYGMKKYVLVILKTGPRENADRQTIDSLFAGHMKNIGRLVELGKLVVAGPMQKNEKTYRGIFILNASSMEEASALLDTDPAIKGGLLEPELFGWYGSAALPMYLKYHPVIQQKNL